MSLSCSARAVDLVECPSGKAFGANNIHVCFVLRATFQNRIVDLTDAGRVFVEEARSSLIHMERAFHLGRAAHEGCDSSLIIGCSPYVDHSWIAAILAIRLPLYPRLRIRLMTQFAMESVRSVLVDELNVALVTAPPQDAQITSVPFTRAPLYAALLETHPAAHKERMVLQDLAKNDWILFAIVIAVKVGCTVLVPRVVA